MGLAALNLADVAQLIGMFWLVVPGALVAGFLVRRINTLHRYMF